MSATILAWVVAGCQTDLVLPPLPAPPQPAACLAWSPTRIVHPIVRADRPAWQPAVLHNGCDVPVQVTGLTFAGDAAFAASVHGRRYVPSQTLAESGASFDPPWQIPAGQSVTWQTEAWANDPDTRYATLVVESDDPVVGLGLALGLASNTTSRCLTLSHKAVDFGAEVVGTTKRVDVVVRSACANAVTLTDVSLQGDDAGAFRLAVAEEGAVLLDPGQQTSLSLTYTPRRVATVGVDGERARDRGELVITSNGHYQRRSISLVGIGVAQPCSVPALVQRGLSLAEWPVDRPLTVSAADSSGLVGPIERYHFSVTAPVPWLSRVYDPQVLSEFTLTPNLVGTWVVAVDVEDAGQQRSCAPATLTLDVKTAAELRVELLWDTPNDPDPFDIGTARGTDLDLHLLHPFAVGVDVTGDGDRDGWFDIPFDTFFGNPAPEWGSFDAKVLDDPRLVADDEDGQGPEVIELPTRPLDRTFRIGVHSYDQHNYGASEVVVRIAVDGQIIASDRLEVLHADDLWWVGDIGPDGHFTSLTQPDGLPLISPLIGQFDVVKP